MSVCFSLGTLAICWFITPKWVDKQTRIITLASLACPMYWPLLLLFVTGFALTSVADAEKPFPLLGIWHAVPQTASDRTSAPEEAEVEFEFIADGTMFITMQFYRANADVVRLRCHYHYKPPNIVTYIPHGNVLMRKRFTVIANKVYFEDLDFSTKGEFRHIAKSEFTHKPRDVKGLSELPK